MWCFYTIIWSSVWKGRTLLRTLFCPRGNSQQSVFGISLGIFFLGHRKNWWVCLIVVCPCWPSVPCNTGRTKTATGHCTMQYFQSFIIVQFHFFSLFKLFLSSVGIISTEYCYSIVLKKLQTSSFFIWQFTVRTYIASEELRRCTD